MADKNRISRRKVLAMVAGTGAAASVGGAGTFAYFSDSKSMGLSFETGSLLVSVENGGKLEFKDMDEGEVTLSLDICNSGTLPIRNVIISNVDITGGEKKVARALEIKSMNYGEEDVSALLPSDDNSNGIVDLQDLANKMSDVSLTDQSDKLDGLKKENDEKGKKGECQTLKIVAELDYSNLEEGLDGKKVSASIDIKAEQEPI